MIDANHPDLPDAIREEDPRPAEAEKSEEELAAEHYRHLQKLGHLIGGKRDEAVKARRESGIEDVWTACEEAYAGIDDLNRTGDSQQWRKPTSIAGPLTRNVSGADANRSSVFIRLTTRYVDMGAAKVKEKALPIDDKPFALKPTPVPDVVDITAQAQSTPNPASAQPAQPTPVAAAVSEATRKNIQVKAAADKASDRIYDWMGQASYPTHIRRVIDDAARIGVGVMKGPFPDILEEKAFTIEDGEGVLEIKKRTVAGLTAIDPWNLFPAGNCGENIHDGDHVFERSFYSESKLANLKKLVEPLGAPIYLADQIDKVIAEGPEKCKLDATGGRKEMSTKDGMYTVWHYTGQMSRTDMVALGAIGAEDLPDSLVDCHAIVTLVNDTVIRAQFNPLEKSGHFPYRVFCWSRRAGYWAGVGPAEQVAVPQRMVNGGTRAWLNNAGVSSGVQIVFDESRLYPKDNSLVIGGGVKLWGVTAEGAGMDVRTLMTVVSIPNLGEQLKPIIDYAFKLAEEMSNIPLVSQGQTGPQDPQTFGQAELQNSNANTLLRQIADNLDGDVIKPLVDDFYEWLLLDPEVPNDEKGDFKVFASGCSAMVEKAIQEQTLMALGPMTLNPAFGMSPTRWAEEMARAKRLDPERLKLSPEELAAVKNSPPPEAPQVQVAKINAAKDVHVQDMRNQATLQQVQAEATHEQALLQSGGTTPHMAMATARIEQERIRATTAQTVEASRAHAEAARADKEFEIARQNGMFKIQEMQLQRDLAILQYTAKHNLTLEQTKASLAQTAMQEQTRRQLGAAELELARNEGAHDRAHDLTKHAVSLQRDEIATDKTP